MTLLYLFYHFFKTGLFAVGGGLATLPFLQRMGEQTGWFTAGQLADMLAISESTPGPIGVNMATYVGYTVGGIPGAVVATLGLIAPSIIIILVIAAFLKNFGKHPLVQSAFYGLRPASMGLVAAAGLSTVVLTFVDSAAFRAGDLLGTLHWPSVALAAVLILLTRVIKPTRKWHPIVFIALSAVVGMAFRFGEI